MDSDSSSAEEVARRSGSNLAFALWCLPREKRRDMTMFYAFCRQVDDLADEPTAPVEERLAKLERWKAVVWGRVEPVTPVERGMVELLRAYPVSPALLEEIIMGMEMDLRGESYGTYKELERYCYRVASAVGLVSVEIFGYTREGARDYAVELGQALQLTNILRDVREDIVSGGRIYLPGEDLAHFGVSRQDLMEGRETEGFRELMRWEAERVRARFVRAGELLPREDRRSLRASELMRRLYLALFQKMERDGFQVLSRRYRLKAWEKVVLLMGAGVSGA